MVVVAALVEFKAWHVNHQDSCTWLNYSRVATLQPVLALLGNVKTNFNYRQSLKVGDSILCYKHEKIMRLVKETIERLQIGMVT